MVRISDTFNRADSSATLGNTNTGETWVPLQTSGGAGTPTWGIQTNRAYVATQSGAHDVAVVESGLADVVVTATASVVSNTFSIVFRCVDKDNMMFTELSGGLIYFYKVVTGIFTDLSNGGVAYTAADGDVVQVEASGSTITVRVNGVMHNTITDSTNLTATRHGLRTFVDSPLTRFDDFSITEIPHCIVTLLGTTL